MKITHKFTAELLTRGVSEHIHAMQNDTNTRQVEVTLQLGGEAWPVPEGTAVSVAFRNLKDGHKGWYDQLPDGTPACTVSGNVVTAQLAPAVLSGAGQVHVVIVFQDADLNQLATFGFLIFVGQNPAAGSTIANDYYAYSTMEAVNSTFDVMRAALEELAGAGGIAPQIGPNGNWFLGITDTGKPAQGPQGLPGTTPHIGENGNWYLGNTDTGICADPARSADVIDRIYPVNSIYICYSETSPASLFGGTWQRMEDAFLWGCGADGEIGSTGGEMFHALTEEEMPSHNHDSITISNRAVTPTGESGSLYKLTGSWNGRDDGEPFVTSYSGNGEAHNNMPPYISVAIWRRVA